MKTVTSLSAAAVLLMMAGSALAQGSAAPSPIQQSRLDYLLADAAQSAGVPSASPSDRPSAPPPAPAVAAAPADEEEAAEEPFKIFKLPGLERRGIDIRGWFDGGFTWNPDAPANRFNGPVTFNDRANEFQMNQLYLITERATKTNECKPWDIGGRVDLMYGTDSRFNTAYGLDSSWNQSERFYGLALPQLYADVAYQDWIFRVGRFYTVVGYETPMAPDNFFYSHSYSMQYGEPFTNTGMLAKYKLNDRWSISAGFHQGWDQWSDINDELGFLGNVSWNLPNDKTTLAVGLVTSNEQVGVESTRSLLSTVITHKFNDKLTYVFQNDLGRETNLNGAAAEWWGWVNYLTYSLNDCWAVGGRYEIFTDDDGSRVYIIGGRGDVGFPMGPARAAHWQELSLGVNYKPNLNVLVRSELRWDWVDPIEAGVGAGAFDDQTNGGQFLWGTDLIIKF